jgi:hypothetical protein
MSTHYCKLPHSSMKPGDLLILETEDGVWFDLCLSNDLVKCVKLFDLKEGYTEKVEYGYSYVRNYLKKIEILCVDGTLRTFNPEDLEDA